MGIHSEWLNTLGLLRYIKNSRGQEALEDSIFLQNVIKQALQNPDRSKDNDILLSHANTIHANAIREKWCYQAEQLSGNDTQTFREIKNDVLTLLRFLIDRRLELEVDVMEAGPSGLFGMAYKFQKKEWEEEGYEDLPKFMKKVVHVANNLKMLDSIDPFAKALSEKQIIPMPFYIANVFPKNPTEERLRVMAHVIASLILVDKIGYAMLEEYDNAWAGLLDDEGDLEVWKNSDLHQTVEKFFSMVKFEIKKDLPRSVDVDALEPMEDLTLFPNGGYSLDWLKHELVEETEKLVEVDEIEKIEEEKEWIYPEFLECEFEEERSMKAIAMWKTLLVLMEKISDVEADFRRYFTAHCDFDDFRNTCGNEWKVLMEYVNHKRKSGLNGEPQRKSAVEEVVRRPKSDRMRKAMQYAKKEAAKSVKMKR